ncbi:prolipoprotein diacylglyceryl transferase [Sporomusa acidovorans]|uniref:Phosphatidylglycerol--prolipoprotein diacylglyceryl transferase n=1 Tax=Sporomusa acidovorans (strain ATCC 49682 / DSM 3132 / Mol) TaxID=1123286 RepID=A0ABZ3J140_SPOA4|nr:prolipoprotein diacylglyceryl transferase [Sporomusa acidovorans]OZC13595.1 prolipoprotein diacylglyceryl transferase [Sporomusa acidovorans DSM 3132]SDE87181.1 phosphatidylglycerol:prolipoprotein diacylglycerol transferase [Sporomusa acidovorans]
MGKIAFSIGMFNFSWFGIILATAIIVAVAINWYNVRLHRENSDKFLDLTLYSIPVGLVGARLYYVAVNWEIYAESPGEILQLSHGGLAVHGAIIGVILTIWLYSRATRNSFWRWGDIVAPGLILGQGIGQWGNFINQDAFGYPTDAPWGIYIDYIYRPPGYEQFDFFHPIFLYEFCWDLFVFSILFALNWLIVKRPNKLAPGSLFLFYLFLYSAGRFVIEGLRLDSETIGGWRLAQVVSITAMFITGLLVIGRNFIKTAKF